MTLTRPPLSMVSPSAPLDGPKEAGGILFVPAFQLVQLAPQADKYRYQITRGGVLGLDLLKGPLNPPDFMSKHQNF